MTSPFWHMVDFAIGMYGVGFIVVMFSALAMILRRFGEERGRGVPEYEAMEIASHATRRAFGLGPDTVAGAEDDAYAEDAERTRILAALRMLDEPDTQSPTMLALLERALKAERGK